MEKTRFIRISARDNVAVAVEALRAGEEACGVTLTQDIPAGHKFALLPIAAGEDVIKYAFPIGHATADIAPGAWVHTHLSLIHIWMRAPSISPSESSRRSSLAMSPARMMSRPGDQVKSISGSTAGKGLAASAGAS